MLAIDNLHRKMFFFSDMKPVGIPKVFTSTKKNLLYLYSALATPTLQSLKPKVAQSAAD